MGYQHRYVDKKKNWRLWEVLIVRGMTIPDCNFFCVKYVQAGYHFIPLYVEIVVRNGFRFIFPYRGLSLQFKRFATFRDLITKPR